MTTRNPEDLEAQLQAAADEMKNLETANDVKKWWNKHYYALGHKRLGRLLLGQPVERLLERASGNRGDD